MLLQGMGKERKLLSPLCLAALQLTTLKETSVSQYPQGALCPCGPGAVQRGKSSAGGEKDGGSPPWDISLLVKGNKHPLPRCKGLEGFRLPPRWSPSPL